MLSRFYLEQISDRLEELTGHKITAAILEIAVNEALDRKERYDYDERMGRII